jgi:N-hydroxyarylamine O-acetyltransferase
MTADFDIDSYFRRIGYSGSAAPSLETLAAIHRCHAEALAFENLNPLLGLPVLLDTQSLQQKLLRQGRGGYCYEQNLLACSALKSLGFRVAGLAARVVYGIPEGVTLPRTHMLLRVEVGNTTYVADVGFGGLTLTGPLRLEPEVEQSTPHEPFRLLQDGDDWQMQAKVAGSWKALYHFTLQEQTFPDYEVANWYVSTHPRSLFVNNLIAARPDRDRRCALLNNEFVVHFLDGRTERQVLSSVAELRDALEGPFRIALPDTPKLDNALKRLFDRQNQSRAGAAVADSRQ